MLIEYFENIYVFQYIYSLSKSKDNGKSYTINNT